jgi:hypothetical protein
MKCGSGLVVSGAECAGPVLGALRGCLAGVLPWASVFAVIKDALGHFGKGLKGR